ncbi:MAG: pyruvate kinase [Coprobacillus sp.]|nr:pyruvate kinase [Coprobacillus sp.]
MRRTKIICTVGPACESQEMIENLMKAGMNVARLNFSHGTHADHKVRIDKIKAAREKLGLPIAIMLDTKGPEYRLRNFKNGPVTVKEGDTFTFTTDQTVLGDETQVAVNYLDMPHDVSIGDIVTANDGLVVFKVTGIDETHVTTKVVTGGELSNQKSMSFKNKKANPVYLSDEDKDDLLFGIEQDLDFIAASFVSCKQDVVDLRNFLDANGGENIDIIAKIENRDGVNNIDEICEVADGIMVARGDLGVEIPLAEVPMVQKQLISECRLLGKRVITATEMLESMIHNPRPTRAEVSDIANAVVDGSSAIMLSGETANGKYPIESVKTMSEVAEFTEENTDYTRIFNAADYQVYNATDALSYSTCSMAIKVNAKAVAVSTVSGKTAYMVSRFRCPVPIMGITIDEKTYRKLNLSWGVTPLMTVKADNTDDLYKNAFVLTRDALDLQKGDVVVLTGGRVKGLDEDTEDTDTIKLITVR